jgi:hypothetical protein
VLRSSRYYYTRTAMQTMDRYFGTLAQLSTLTARFEQGVVVHDCGEDGIFVSSSHLHAVGVTVEWSGEYGVHAQQNAKVQLQGCTVRGNGVDDYLEIGAEIVRR